MVDLVTWTELTHWALGLTVTVTSVEAGAGLRLLRLPHASVPSGLPP